METLLLTPSSLNSSACSAEYVIDLLYPQQAEATHRSRDEEVAHLLGLGELEEEMRNLVHIQVHCQNPVVYMMLVPKS
jgi:hypothetical protein